VAHTAGSKHERTPIMATAIKLARKEGATLLFFAFLVALTFCI
jgi:hypothetical protein